MLFMIAAAALLIGNRKNIIEYFTNPLDDTQQIETKVAIENQVTDPNQATENELVIDKYDPELKRETELVNINRTLKASYLAMAFVTAGKFFYILHYSGAAILSYIAIKDMIDAYEVWNKDKKIGIEFFDSVTMFGLIATGYIFITSLTTVIFYTGRKLLLQAQGQNKKSIAGLFEHHQQKVWIVKDDAEIEMPIASLKAGDIISIRAGESIAADGVIISGNALIDQQKLTGESQPVEKIAGDQVLASTLLLAGQICVQVEKSGKDTVAANIEKVWQQTIDFKTNIQSKGEKLAENTVVPTLVMSAIALPITGYQGTLAILYSYIGYDIRIFAPLSMLNFMKVAAKNGILIKDGRAMELIMNVDTVVFDKTGTLTSEQPYVARLHTYNNYNETEVLSYAVIAEKRQTHPIAKAILAKAANYNFADQKIDDIHYEIGHGIKIKLAEDIIRVGSPKFMKIEGISITNEIETFINDCYYQGYTLVMVAKNETIIGAIELHNSIRPEAYQVIEQLQKRNKKIYIISGDHAHIVKNIANDLNIDNYFAEIFPEQKSTIIAELQQQGNKVCFIGDGINDSIAMKVANVSISLHGASQAAIDTADIILMDGTLNNVNRIFELADEINHNLDIAMQSAVIPGAINISSVFFMNKTIGSALIVNSVGLIVGTANGFLPLLKKK